MNNIQTVTEVAKGISDYGFMVIVCAVFIILSLAMMITCFKWFKTVIEQIMDEYTGKLETLQELAMKNHTTMVDIAEGLMVETQLRIKAVANSYFDLSTYKVLDLIEKVRTENHIADKEATHQKIRRLLTNLYNDRNSKFDAFTYRGRKLSTYCDSKWIKEVEKVIASELYNESGRNDSRSKTNVKTVYDYIKTEFYKNLQE